MIDIDLEFAEEPKRAPATRSMQDRDNNPRIGRQPPHSVEAEEYLLSCCLLDGSDSIAKCIEKKLPEEAFYVAPNRIIYRKLVELYRPNKPVAIEILAEELKAAGLLDDIGGLPYLMQVSGRIPTTAQTDYFLERVSDLHFLRRMVIAATRAVEQCYECKSGVTELIAGINHDIAGIERSSKRDSTWQSVPLIDFKAPPANDSSILLGKYRYLCRGGTAVAVGPSHVGKSSMCWQWAVAASLGRDFLGIETHGKLVSLIVNGEDDDGDVGEASESIGPGFCLNDDERDQVRRRVHVIKARMETGQDFFNELKRAVAKYKPDIVWINPLLAFAGIDITKPGEASKLRAMLNGANEAESFAYMIVHHTNKPPAPASGNGKVNERNWNEFMYNMTGSADIVNLARVVITIEAKKKPGEFLIRLAKRGKRAGITRTIAPDPEKGQAVYRTEIVTEIHARHADTMLKLEDGREIPMVFWYPDEDGASKAAEERASSPKKGGKPSTHNVADFRPVFMKHCYGRKNLKGFNALHRACMQIKKIGVAALYRVLDEAVEGGVLNRDPDGYYIPNPTEK